MPLMDLHLKEIEVAGSNPAHLIRQVVAQRTERAKRFVYLLVVGIMLGQEA